MEKGAVLQLANRVRGSVVTPEDDAYQTARLVWNGTIDKNPALIVSCHDSSDVVEAVNFARSHHLGVSVRSGGHHVAGSAVLEGGLVIDMSPMHDVRVDASTQRALVAGGAQIGDVDRATQTHALAVPLGLVSKTGVAGLTLAGGYGWLRRSCGLSCDNVLAADVVTAQGRELHVSSDENPDLFWALRGGGWDLAVVTAIDYRAHPVGPDVFFPFVTYPLEEGVDVLMNLREFLRTAPREFGSIVVCWTFPEVEDFPREYWGRQFMAVVGPYVGDAAEGERVCAALQDLGPVLTNDSCMMPWLDAQQFFDADYPDGRRYHWKSCHLTELSAEAAEAFVDLASRRPSPLTSLDLWPNGGAIADVPAESTPFGLEPLSVPAELSQGLCCTSNQVTRIFLVIPPSSLQIRVRRRHPLHLRTGSRRSAL